MTVTIHTTEPQVGLSGQATQADLQALKATAQKANDSYASIVQERIAQFGYNYVDESEFLERVLLISSGQKPAELGQTLNKVADTYHSKGPKPSNTEVPQPLNTAEQPQGIPAAKALAKEMHREYKQLKADNTSEAFRKSPEFREVAKNHDEIMKAVFAPKIPAWILTKCTGKLSAIGPLLETFAKECRTLAEFADAKQLEDQINAYIQAVKNELLVDLQKEGLNLSSFDFQATIQETDLQTKVHTALTTELEKVTAPFRMAQEAKANEQLAFLKQTLHPQDMGGGGDCLFRSLAGCLGQNPNLTHSDLRTQLVKQMRQNPTRYAELVENRIATEDTRIQRQIAISPGKTHFERYLNWVNQPSNWGGTPEIQAMSDLLQRPIVVVQAINNRGTVTESLNTVYPMTLKEKTPLAILNAGQMTSDTEGTGVHFVSLLPN